MAFFPHIHFTLSRLAGCLLFVACALSVSGRSPEPCGLPADSVGPDPVCNLSVSAIAGLSSGTFAPHLMAPVWQGRIVQGRNLLLDAGVFRPMSAAGRWSWGFGAELVGGSSSPASYSRWYDAERTWGSVSCRPSEVWVQQLYAEARHRAVFLQAGMKEQTSVLVDPELSSGDFVYSGNCRPIPQVMTGLWRFCDIPFTSGALQVRGAISYGKMTDSQWVRDHFNYYNYHIAAGQLWTYKFIHFRTNPSWRLSAEFGAQLAAFFGGKAVYYDKGRIYRTLEYRKDLQSFINMIFPVLKEEEAFVQGQNLGSWDFKARYTLDDSRSLSAYFQWPFEDGSGIARRNGWDGIWGLQYNCQGKAPVTGAVVEYVDFRNQSGPLHYSPGDFGDTDLTTNLTGRDNYYNNSFYNAYANYGMAIGTPFMISPVYNLDGYPAFACNRMNGFHAGVKGWISPNLGYRALFSYRRGMGTYDYPYPATLRSFSAMVQGFCDIGCNWRMSASLALDAGRLQGRNVGAMLTLTYTTPLR